MGIRMNVCIYVHMFVRTHVQSCVMTKLTQVMSDPLIAHIDLPYLQRQSAYNSTCTCTYIRIYICMQVCTSAPQSLQYKIYYSEPQLEKTPGIKICAGASVCLAVKSIDACTYVRMHMHELNCSVMHKEFHMSKKNKSTYYHYSIYVYVQRRWRVRRLMHGHVHTYIHMYGSCIKISQRLTAAYVVITSELILMSVQT